MTRFLVSTIAIALLAPSYAAAEARNQPSPAELGSSMATARAQIARYRFTPPQSGEDRCFDLKQIVRSLRAAQQPAEQAQWHEQMRRACAAAHKSTDL